MTRTDKGHYANKHPAGLRVNPEIAEAVKKRASAQKIPCVGAFSIVNKLNVEPHEIGITIDSLEITISKCQLGLFGYEPDKKAINPSDNVPHEVEEAIRASLKNDRLSCKDAWEIADRFGMKKMAVSSVCEALKIKISNCQLGAFR
jgi:hypothetical protein